MGPLEYPLRPARESPLSKDWRAGLAVDSERPQPATVNDPFLDEYRSTLVELLPALVHRWNNALTTIASVLDLAEGATTEERSLARGQLDRTVRSLRRLGGLVSDAPVASRPVDLVDWLADLAPLLGTIVETRGCGLDLRQPPGGCVVAMDGALERRLAAVLIATLLGLERDGRPQRARLTVRREGVGVLLALALRSRAEVRHLAHLVGGPAQGRSRRRDEVLVIRIVMPALDEDGPRAVAGRRGTPRLLVLENERTAELAELLAQHGYRPETCAELPSAGQYDLLVIDADWARAAGDWRAHVAATSGLARLPVLGLGECPGASASLPRPVPPRALLAEVARLLGRRDS
jgi:hypothetical protein